MNKNYLSVISIAVVSAILDQLTKFAVKQNVGINASTPVIENIFHITYITNTGSAFGIFKNFNLLFIFISIAIMIFIGYYLKNAKSENKIDYAFFGLLLGGIIGNLIDRLMLGHVVDFIDFMVWPVFNLADSFITISVIGLMMIYWKK